jgi:hypothetical protein
MSFENVALESACIPPMIIPTTKARAKNCKSFCTKKAATQTNIQMQIMVSNENTLPLRFEMDANKNAPMMATN